MERRSFLKSLAATALPILPAACVPSGEQGDPERIEEAEEVSTLANAAGSNGRVFGAAVNTIMLKPRSQGYATTLQQCSSITPEWSFKWDKIEPRQGRFDFGDADKIADFARRYDKKVRGHTLLWHLGLPKWAAALMETRDRNPVRDYFEAVMSRYEDIVEEWDVVNEPIDISTGGDNLRRNQFMQAFGRDYIEWSIRMAHDISPKTRLFINEYGLEYASAEEGQRRLSLLQLLERLMTRGVPLHGVGLQAHLDLRKGALDEAGLHGLLRDIAGFGLTISVTELDVREKDRFLDLAGRDTAVADAVRRYLDIVLDFNAVKSVTTWGLSDRDSWLLTGKDGKHDNRGLPYDREWRRKPMRTAIETALHNGRSTA